MSKSLELTTQRLASRGLTIGSPSALLPTSHKDLYLFAQQVAASGLARRWEGKQERVFAVMAKGLELGIPPMTAIETAYEVHGAIGWEIKTLHALVRASGQCSCLRRLESSARACTWIGASAADPEQYNASRWTIGEAPISQALERRLAEYKVEWDDVSHTDASKRKCWEKKRQISLSQKDMYQNMPQVMLSWRALGDVLKITWPDVLMGVSAVEILRDDHSEAQDAEIVEDEDSIEHLKTEPFPRAGLHKATGTRFLEWRRTPRYAASGASIWECDWQRAKVSGAAEVVADDGAVLATTTKRGEVHKGFEDAVLWAIEPMLEATR